MQFNIIAKSLALVKPFFAVFAKFFEKEKKYFKFFQKNTCFLRKDMLQYLSVWKYRRCTLSGAVANQKF